MKKTDLEKYAIKYFSYDEIVGTGADFDSINPEIIFKLDRLRRLLGHSIHLLSNGINSGSHKSREHKAGKAIDFYLQGSLVNPKEIIYSAIRVGFGGIGVYYNSQTDMYSFHCDIGKVRLWTGYKKTRKDSWKYLSFFNDPKNTDIGGK